MQKSLCSVKIISLRKLRSETQDSFCFPSKQLLKAKKLHQFKAYNTLSEDFIKKLSETYPKDLSFEEMRFAKDKMLALYLETVKNSDVFNFDDSLLSLINCFE